MKTYYIRTHTHTPNAANAANAPTLSNLLMPSLPWLLPLLRLALLKTVMLNIAHVYSDCYVHIPNKFNIAGKKKKKIHTKLMISRNVTKSCAHPHVQPGQRTQPS